MSPRKASIRVAHMRACRKANATALTSLRGCTCQPSYYVFRRDRDGRPVKSARVKDRRTVDAMLRHEQREIDEGRGGVRSQPKLDFNQWADEYTAILEDKVQRGNRKPRTLDGYRQTLERARVAFGSAHLDEIGRPELRRFDAATDIRPASRLRYLRELSACLQAAVDEGNLKTNPVPAFTKSLGLEKPRRGKAPFERSELARLWLALRKVDPVYLAACRFSSEAGLRLRELVGLDWQQVSLSERTAEVIEQWHERYGAGTPKGNRIRTVHLTREAARVLEQWVTIIGARDSGPVFPQPMTGGRLSAQVVQSRLSAAMVAAGIPKLHPTMRDETTGQRLPRSFHSLRYSCAVLMRSRHEDDLLVQATLGHAEASLTHEVYGRPSDAVLAEMARRRG